MAESGKCGRVYWITGLAGAGKTAVGTALYRDMRRGMDNIVFLDGDELRGCIASDLGYTREERKEAAMRYARLAALLAGQGIHVVVATISMFHAVREWNRGHIQDYCEVYLKVPMEVLRERNQKCLYTDVADGKMGNVMGMDMDVEEPEAPDLVIPNDGGLGISECVEMIKGLGREGRA